MVEAINALMRVAISQQLEARRCARHMVEGNDANLRAARSKQREAEAQGCALGMVEGRGAATRGAISHHGEGRECA